MAEPAEPGLSVCVRGLPSGMEHERLHDKLMIHFLRERHGGGEISSISIKANDPYAIVTFEDSGVALSACSHSPHVLEVDGKTYELSLSFLWQDSQHLNKVILDMAVTIDCNHLPLGEKAMKTLSEKFSGLSVNYITSRKHCTIKGPYSEVKDFFSHLVALLVEFKHPSEECMSIAQELDGVYLYQKLKEISPDQSHGVPFGGNGTLQQESTFLTPKDNTKIKLSQVQTSFDEKTKDWVDTVDVDAQTLIMEADVFAYLRSKSVDYKRILKNHKLYVVDVTSAGVTTLYLQSHMKVNTGSKAEKHMKHAHKELSQLYQQVEGNLRRDHFPRSALYLNGDPAATFKQLESLLSNVLLSFDQTNVYIVGERSEVSQAKQILMFGSSDENLRAKQEISPSSSPSNSPVSESETTGAGMESSTIHHKQRMSDTERRVRTGEEYKLAARFKNSDIGLLGFGSVERGRTRERQDFSKGINPLTLASNPGPTLSTSSFLVTPGTVTSDQNRISQLSSVNATGINNVKEDILSQRMESSSTCTLKNKGQVSGNTERARFLSCTSRLTPTGSTGEPTTTSTSSLKRTNSFSGQPLQKQETDMSGINEKACLGTNSFRRPRSSSVNSRMSQVSLQSSSMLRTVTVPSLMWGYIKEAYCSDLSSLIYEIQVSESQKDKSNTVLTLQGSSLSKVEKCQSELQKLVDMIGLDFFSQMLLLADLGVTEGNEIFKECCTTICSHFNKIVLRHVKDAILLMGPKSLCSQVREKLKELFPGGFSHTGPLDNTFSHQGTVNQSQASTNQAPVKSNSQIRANQTKADSETLAKCKLEGHQSDLRSEAYMQSSKPVANEMPKLASDLEVNKTAQLSGKSSEVPGVLLGLRGDWKKHSSPTQKIQKGTTLTLKQTNLPITKQVESCVCGEIGAQTRCGVFRCANCILLHAQCIVCSKVNAPSKELQVHQLKRDQNTKELIGKEVGKGNKQEQGIQGTMRYNETSLSLPGYEQYRTIKITYHIPDGIQGEEHPNPGFPFQGGVFEAYLPLSSKGQGLLQCLEKAFKQGFVFTVCPSNNTGTGGAKITWNRIPHKTNITGGKSGNGYPDSTYLKDLSAALRICGILGV